MMLGQTYDAKLNLFFLKMSFSGVSKSAVIGFMILGIIITIAAYVLFVGLGVWAVNDIIAHGAQFWNVAAIIFILACITGKSQEQAKN